MRDVVVYSFSPLTISFQQCCNSSMLFEFTTNFQTLFDRIVFLFDVAFDHFLSYFNFITSFELTQQSHKQRNVLNILLVVFHLFLIVAGLRYFLFDHILIEMQELLQEIILNFWIFHQLANNKAIWIRAVVPIVYEFNGLLCINLYYLFHLWCHCILKLLQTLIFINLALTESLELALYPQEYVHLLLLFHHNQSKGLQIISLVFKQINSKTQ